MSGGYSLDAVRGLLLAGASLVSEHGFWGSWASAVVTCGLSSCWLLSLGHKRSSCGAQA